MDPSTPPTKIEQALNLDYRTEEEDIWLSKQKTLRKLVGFLGILLPILLFLFLKIDTGYGKPLESISHYYYTRVGSIFAIVVSLLAIFLLIYKGKEPVDFYFSSIAGIFALCVVLFPTGNITGICTDPDFPYAVTILKMSDLRENFHYISAGIFLSSLAYMSLFLFTKSDLPKAARTKEKKIRNFIYSLCGILMALALSVIVLERFHLIDPDFYSDHHLTFWMETIAVESFGLSWLTKGEVIFKDA